MTTGEDHNGSTLPPAILALLPEGGRVGAHVQLSRGVDGSEAGQTHLALVGGQFRVFSLPAEAAPPEEVALAPDSFPMMAIRDEQNVLVLVTSGGEELSVPITPGEEERIRPLTMMMLGIAEEEEPEADPEDAPTELGVPMGMPAAGARGRAAGAQSDPELAVEEASIPTVFRIPAGSVVPEEPAEPAEPEPVAEVVVPVPAAAEPAAEPAAESAPPPGRELSLPAAVKQHFPSTPAAQKAAARPAGKLRVKTIFSGADLHERYHRHIKQEEDLDAAFCVADALVFMGKAQEGVRLFHQYHRPQALLRTERMLDDETWRSKVRYPGEDPEIGALMAVISPAVARSLARKPKALGLREEDRRDPATDQLQISRVFRSALQVLEVGPADLYVQTDLPQGLLLADTTEGLAFLAGADLLRGRHEYELMFLVARQLALVKPQYFLVNLLPSPLLLRPVALAAIKLSLPDLPIPPEEKGQVEAHLKLLKKQLQAPARQALRAVVSRLVERGGQVDLDDWFFKVQLTADRAALLLCQDLDYATKQIKQGPRLVGAPRTSRRIKDLVRYVLSPEYAAVRKHLGLTVGHK
jgi:hypothetical protein